MKALSILALLVGLSACSSDEGANSSAEHDHGHERNTPTVPGARQVDVTAKSFEFSPAEIAMKADEDVTISLSSTDLLHDFVIDELDVHVAAKKGETAGGGITSPDRGRYTFYCSEPGHRDAGMEGTLVVGR